MDEKKLSDEELIKELNQAKKDYYTYMGCHDGSFDQVQSYKHRLEDEIIARWMKEHKCEQGQ